MIAKYVKYWWLMSRNSFMSVFYAKIALLIFLSGKILRFVFFLIFLYFLVGGTKSLAGYNVNQVIFFFLTFNLVDVVAQFLFREVYRFRPMIVSGDFDLVLVKPVSALFRSLMGGADMIDLFTIPPLIVAIIYVAAKLTPSPAAIVLYCLLVANSLLIAAAFHIAVLALGIITLEIDHTIMIYRDLMNLGRLPVDIYREPIKSAVTYLVPVGIMITVPARVIMGLATVQAAIISFLVCAILLFLSKKLWDYSLTRYSSASS